MFVKLKVTYIYVVDYESEKSNLRKKVLNLIEKLTLFN